MGLLWRSLYRRGKSDVYLVLTPWHRDAMDRKEVTHQYVPTP